MHRTLTSLEESIGTKAEGSGDGGVAVNADTLEDLFDFGGLDDLQFQFPDRGKLVGTAGV